ncbi:hypothetical protein KBY57_13065 [Cyanobium sp. Aljojuca 7D2]|uniref:hypothetical protein n=1 Tax=Cyanobium sp. Aljojuca 7D2 TaxID=2823698 RepID=UPI0020CF3606|nr:hypothetical protein [Cyanobium sp. Aljojuca 7D2]MCP9891975.1 hypothetical protein [Cyanobium sp. Aljojuca 7D2]
MEIGAIAQDPGVVGKQDKALVVHLGCPGQIALLTQQSAIILIENSGAHLLLESTLVVLLRLHQIAALMGLQRKG